MDAKTKHDKKKLLTCKSQTLTKFISKMRN